MFLSTCSITLAYSKHAINILKNSVHLANFYSFPVLYQANEAKLKEILKEKFPKAQSIDVADVSGGCGAMFEISIVADDFKDLSIVKQHKMVTEALKKEIKDMHGLRIQTSV